ncbi:MAG: alpha-L-rhamnosidase C-terminal domain-containing protein [Lentisphaeria bacterium]|jgi:hypothetical protein
MSQKLFAKSARWIWSAGDPAAYQEYVCFQKGFTVGAAAVAAVRKGGRATLRLTAESYYQAWLNGHVIGHGPAKAAEGKRSVDEHEVGALLAAGENRLEILVLGNGVGTMTTCPADAGLIFQVELDGQTVAVSDKTTLAQPDPRRRRRTVRRWMLPCLEDVDAAAAAGAWQPACELRKPVELYPRRVPLPAREPIFPQRLVAAEAVRPPNFSCSLRLKPYLTSPKEARRCNIHQAPAWVVTDILSPVAQEMRFTPTLGSLEWHCNGQRLFAGSGWAPWDPATAAPAVRLKKGANRLVGVHGRDHFEEINLCAFVETPVRAVNPFGAGAFQVIPLAGVPPKAADLAAPDWAALRTAMPEMNPEHSFGDGNAFDLALGAEVLRELAIPFTNPLELPATPAGEAVRVILDLGVLHNGWLAFTATGPAAGKLVIAGLEALDDGPPRRLQWPAGSNNALIYRLREGRQIFESFLPYGVRHLVVQYSGPAPLRLEGLRLLTANCGSRRRGAFLSSEPLLNGVYQISTQAILSATDDTYTDCPTFEQVNWNFDNRMSALTDAGTCGNWEVMRNSIELFTEDPAYPGLVRSQYPSAWDNRIPMWSFHWIFLCLDHYRLTGDAAFTRRIFPQVAAGIEEGLGMVGPHGLLEWPPGPDTWHFVEWGHGRDDDHAVVSAEQAGFAGAIATAAELGRVVGADEALLARWGRARAALLRALRRQLWDPRRDAFRDSLHEDGTPSAVASQASNAALALYGAGGQPWARRLARRICANDQQLLPYQSPVGSYYVLELLDRFGKVEELFAVIRRRWGQMLLAGDTTTWEHFGEFGHAGWPTRSRCHPFASYVTKYFVKYLLGIEALAPGFQRVRIRPRPPRGLARCQGAIPTPHGLLRVAWERDARGRVQCRWAAPAGVTVA